jgi:hypothetical protein
VLEEVAAGMEDGRHSPAMRRLLAAVEVDGGWLSGQQLEDGDLETACSAATRCMKGPSPVALRLRPIKTQ